MNINNNINNNDNIDNKRSKCKLKKYIDRCERTGLDVYLPVTAHQKY